MESHYSRRQFLTTTATALASASVVPALAANPITDSSPRSPHDSAAHNGRGSFPEQFRWGASTSAYQIEGAVAEDGRKPSIWDTFSRMPGRTAHGDTGEIACDHYHRYESDVRLMAELGITDYRFSISWSRVTPDGTGSINEKGVDFYKKLIDALKKYNITPRAALFHWDLPQALQERYEGWQNKRIASDFADYAAAVVKRLGDRVSDWVTMNEISSFTGGGHGVGKPPIFAPGVVLATERDQQQVIHHALLAHGMACQAIRAAAPGKCTVGLAENYDVPVPLIETPEHIEAARNAFLSGHTNGGLLVPVLTGRYDETWLREHADRVPNYTDADMRNIGQPLDWLGFNCYTGKWVQAAATTLGYEMIPSYPGYPAMSVGWLRLLPEVGYWGVRLITDALKRPDLPVFITENGCPDSASADEAGNVVDTDRIFYMRSYLSQIQRAVSEGYPLKGYFVWSIMDNFEWIEGYNKRFGIVHNDFKTQKRTPKASYGFFQQVIRNRRVM